MSALNIEFSDASSEGSSVSNISEFSGSSEYRFLLYEIIPGARRKSKLLYTKEEKQFYYFNSTNSGGDAFLCAAKNCKSRCC